MNSTSALITKLVELRATLRSPATPQAIMQAENALHARFPDGIRDFYTSCDGVEDATAEWIWDFFSLRTLIERTLQRREQQFLRIDNAEELPYNKLVCFCDVLIDAPTYLFCADPSSCNYARFYADQGYEGWLVADTYDEFVQIFVSQNGNVLLNV